MTIKSFLEGFDLIAARLRHPLRVLAGFGIALQGLIVAGAIKVPPGDKWSNAVALGGLVLAYFTPRGPNEAAAVARAKQLDETPVANAGGPAFPPSFPPRKPTRESEALTPAETPRSKTRP